MKRELLRTNAFIRAAKKLVKRQPGAGPDIASALQLLGEDAFLPSFKTHKLKGVLDGSWACSASYDLRIVLNLSSTREGKLFFSKRLEPTMRYIESDHANDYN